MFQVNCVFFFFSLCQSTLFHISSVSSARNKKLKWTLQFISYLKRGNNSLVELGCELVMTKQPLLVKCDYLAFKL